MPATVISNVDLALTGNFVNTGNIPANVEPGIPKAIVLVAKGTTIPATAFASQAAFLTYVTASAQGFIADTRNPRWLILQNCDDFKDETKKMSNLDTGLNQFDTTKFNIKYNFRYISNKANHQEVMGLDNTNIYDCYVWDANTNIWGQKDLTGNNGGMSNLTISQLRIMDFVPADAKTGMNEYRFSIQFKNRAEFNENFAIWNTGIDSDNIATLRNAVMNDVSGTLGTPLTITTTTDIVCVMKAGQNSIDLASPQYYQSVLTKACFTAKNRTLGTTLTISTLNKGSIVVAGQAYNYLWFILSAAPTATNVVEIALAAPSVVNAIIPGFNAVTEIVSLGIDGQNAAVHTF